MCKAVYGPIGTNLCDRTLASAGVFCGDGSWIYKVVKHLASFTLFETRSFRPSEAQPLYGLLLYNGTAAALGLVPQNELEVIVKFLDEHLDHQSDDMYSFTRTPILPDGADTVVLNGQGMELIQTAVDQDLYFVEESWLTRDLFKNQGIFLMRTGGTQSPIGDWLEAIQVMYPDLVLPGAEFSPA